MMLYEKGNFTSRRDRYHIPAEPPSQKGLLHAHITHGFFDREERCGTPDIRAH